MNPSWVKLTRSENTVELIEKHPKAFLLLSQIALRARRTSSKVSGLEPGEALIGDFKKAGLTQQEYRTAKIILNKLGFATFRTTNRGTIAKLLDTSIFDINIEVINERDNEHETNRNQTGDELIATNKNGRSRELNNGKNKDMSARFEKFYSEYPKKMARKDAEKAFRQLNPNDELLNKMLAALSSQKASKQWSEGIIPLPATWLRGERWNDVPLKKILPANHKRPDETQEEFEKRRDWEICGDD
jgi:hypothetical protein